MVAKNLIEMKNRSKEELIAMSIKYGILSPYTAFVAVEKRNGTHMKEALEKDEVPIVLSKGWDILSLNSRINSQFKISEHFESSSLESSLQRVCAPIQFNASVKQSSSGCCGGRGGGGDGSTTTYSAYKNVSNSNPVQLSSTDFSSQVMNSTSLTNAQEEWKQIVLLQQFDGHFELTEAFAKHFKTSLQELTSKKPKTNLTSDQWATILALMWFRKKCPDKQEELELITQKAISWLQNQSTPIDFAHYETFVESLF